MEYQIGMNLFYLLVQQSSHQDLNLIKYVKETAIVNIIWHHII